MFTLQPQGKNQIFLIPFKNGNGLIQVYLRDVPSLCFFVFFILSIFLCLQKHINNLFVFNFFYSVKKANNNFTFFSTKSSSIYISLFLHVLLTLECEGLSFSEKWLKTKIDASLNRKSRRKIKLPFINRSEYFVTGIIKFVDFH